MMISKKFVVVLVLSILLIGVITFEQVYTDNAINDLTKQVDKLNMAIEVQDYNNSQKHIDGIIRTWEKDESIICLFVDFRDIENIGKQAMLVKGYIDNQDFELAHVEAQVLATTILTFKNMISFDWQNIV